jgi:hypothetical protein
MIATTPQTVVVELALMVKEPLLQAVYMEAFSRAVRDQGSGNQNQTAVTSVAVGLRVPATKAPRTTISLNIAPYCCWLFLLPLPTKDYKKTSRDWDY